MKNNISSYVVLLLALFVCSLPLAWNRKSPVQMQTLEVVEQKLPTYNIEFNDKNLYCMTEALFHEAGIESLDGKEAVALVILNRAAKAGNNVCHVVNQSIVIGTKRHCQFSYVCMHERNPANTNANWVESLYVAKKVLRNDFNVFVFDLVGSADHYHANYVAPYWAKKMTFLAQIDTHLFYRR